MNDNPSSGYESDRVHTQLLLPAEPSSVAEARRFVRRTLVEWGLKTLGDTVVLVASELTTNAILHTESSPVLRLSLQSRRLRLEIADASVRSPRTRHYGMDATTGRGMLMVESLATQWGSDVRESGKVVWCEFVVE